MNNKRLKRQCFVSLILVIIMGFVLFSTYEESEANQYEGIIRLHVIANSDSKEDQELKLKVRDAVIKEVGDLRKDMSEDEVREYIKSHLDDITARSSDVIAENGEKYSVSANLGVRWIPEKSYGDIYFPAGNYEALTITIGEGKGQNWWCVLFPPLCLIDASPEEMGVDPQEQIKVKSWLKEVLAE